MDPTSPMVMDKAAFAAYRELRQIADQYKIDVEPPRIVFVGETSTGKSMLVQTFLGFPCTFTNAGVATRCPVAYQLRYNPYAKVRRVLKPAGVEPKDLATHIGQHMQQIERKCQFSHEPYYVEIESNSYPDLEILDVPGVVAGHGDLNVRDAVERITEIYVRNPKFIIVLLVDANQEIANCYGARITDELCKGTTDRGSGLPPRPDYKNHMCTIQTKFDIFMANYHNANRINGLVQERLKHFGDTFFVSMVFDGRSMTDETFESNERYIARLPQVEKDYVDRWIQDTDRNSNREEFDSKYRPLIGIDMVRQQIQKRWLKAFYQAVPVLKDKLAQQITHAYDKYETILNECRLVDPALIRDSYLSYLNDFRRTIGQYASYTAEIHNHFPVHKHGTSYEDIETGLSNWSRRQSLVWRAYMNDVQLKQHAYADGRHDQDFVDNLNLKLVGGSQFGRLQRIFPYMILAHKPGEVTRDEIVAIEAFLVGGFGTSPNMEKCLRDLMYRHISATFAIGIPWFSQMHAYLCDTFRTNVSRWLLSQKRYAYLAKHTAFLSLVEVDFHRKMRFMLKSAIQAVRSARLSYSSYVQHDVSAWIKKLTFRIPNAIPHGFYNQTVPNVYVKGKTTTTTTATSTSKADNQNDSFREATIGEVFANIKKPELLDFIFGSDVYLTNERNQRTCSHHDNARQILQELYEVTAGRLVDDINRHFNANLITHVVNYNRVEEYSKRSIANQLTHASDMDITRMANVETQKLLETLQYWKQQIGDLTRASVLLDSVTQQLIGENTTNDVDVDQLKTHAERSAQKSMEILDNQREQVSKSFKRMLEDDVENDDFTTTTTFERIDGEDEETYQDRFLSHTIDPITSEVFLRRIYQHHDSDDLHASLLEGEQLDQDTNALKVDEYINPTNISTMNITNGLLSSTEKRDSELNKELRTDALLEVKMVPYSNLVSTDTGSGARTDLATFRPDLERGWFYLGPCATNNVNQTGTGLLVREVVPGMLADITEWKLIWSTADRRNTDACSFWRGIPPSSDYLVLGDFFVRSSDPPTLAECKGMKAIHKDACAVANVGKRMWKDSGSGAKQDSSVWDISNDGNNDLLLSGAFIAAIQHAKPTRTVYAINPKKVL